MNKSDFVGIDDDLLVRANNSLILLASVTTMTPRKNDSTKPKVVEIKAIENQTNEEAQTLSDQATNKFAIDSRLSSMRMDSLYG